MHNSAPKKLWQGRPADICLLFSFSRQYLYFLLPDSQFNGHHSVANNLQYNEHTSLKTPNFNFYIL